MFTDFLPSIIGSNSIILAYIVKSSTLLTFPKGMLKSCLRSYVAKQTPIIAINHRLRTPLPPAISNSEAYYPTTNFILYKNQKQKIVFGDYLFGI